jgi:hypothetical protein
MDTDNTTTDNTNTDTTATEDTIDTEISWETLNIKNNEITFGCVNINHLPEVMKKYIEEENMKKENKQYKFIYTFISKELYENLHNLYNPNNKSNYIFHYFDTIVNDESYKEITYPHVFITKDEATKLN